ncbi:hypothetical protein K438DRAFT_1962405 [Mycena galopus ATCC 62051]|nr:hypothetical protein K438DRAFT_1962405 [Mycena galopus ATCC 62051]
MARSAVLAPRVVLCNTLSGVAVSIQPLVLSRSISHPAPPRGASQLSFALAPGHWVANNGLQNVRKQHRTRPPRFWNPAGVYSLSCGPICLRLKPILAFIAGAEGAFIVTRQLYAAPKACLHLSTCHATLSYAQWSRPRHQPSPRARPLFAGASAALSFYDDGERAAIRVRIAGSGQYPRTRESSPLHCTPDLGHPRLWRRRSVTSNAARRVFLRLPEPSNTIPPGCSLLLSR